MDRRPWHSAYDPRVPPSLEYEPVTLPGFLARSAARHPDATALVFLNARLTYRELDDQVNRFATALADFGVRKDSRVAIQLPNLPQTVIAYYATLRLGAQAVMTNPLYVPREIEHQWNDAGCTVAVVADFLYGSRVAAIRDRLPVRHYVIASIPEYLRFPLNLLAPLKLRRADPPLLARVPPGPGIHVFRDLVRRTAPSPPAVEIGLDDLAVLQYTGGTTGVSKGAMLTHRNLSCNVQQTSAWFPDAEIGREVLLACLPYFHVFGMTVSMNWPIASAAAIVLMPNPRDVPQIIRSIAKHRVTLFPAVPALFNAINNHPLAAKADLSSVKSCFSGSAPLPVDVLRRFEEITGSTIVEGFGLTETSPVSHVNPLAGRRKVGSVGLPVPDTDCRIVDLEDGTRDLPADTEGELLIRGPQVMAGYWNMPDETAQVLRDRWLCTGDLAVMDPEGYFFIVGRKKDMILASGYNVYPDEVDRVLAAHEAVLEAATIGVPDVKRGETVKSFVVLQPGRKATAEELIAHCRENLAAYKVPREIEFLAELPKSGVMKVLRRELREREVKKAGAAAG
jgi:long-chain acyl-CoA synthetase